MQMIGILAVLSIASTFACGMLAERKGRTVWTWALAGYFFGPIALLILLISRSKANANG